MAPSVVTIDTTPDLDLGPPPTKQNASSPSALPDAAAGPRTLVLAPPSVAAHAERIGALFATFDRRTTDLQMLDRLAGGLVTLPAETYDLVLVLTDADGGRRAEAARLLAGRDVLARLVAALRCGGRLASEDGSLGGRDMGCAEAREAVLAGLVPGPEGFTKPAAEEEVAVPLKFGLKRKGGHHDGGGAGQGEMPNTGAHSSAGPAVGSVAVKAPPAGVGFVTLDGDDLDFLDDDDDDDLMDEDDLLTQEELNAAPPKGKLCMSLALCDRVH